LGPECKDALPTLLGVLKNKDECKGLRISAAKAIGQMGPDACKALPALIEILKDEAEQHSIRILAAKAIGHMGSDAKAAIPSLSSVSVGQDKLFKKAVQKALEEIREAQV
jgi:HEAT repeat protein